MIRYTFWHGKSNENSAKWVAETVSSLQNNTWTSSIYIDGSGWEETEAKREEAAVKIFQSLHHNTSAKSFVFQNAKLNSATDQCFSEAMSRNEGIRSITIRNLSTEEGSYSVPATVFHNATLKSIDLAKISLNGAACEKLSQLIRESSSLQSICLEKIQDIDLDGLQSILSSIAFSKSLISLKIRCIPLNKKNTKRLFRSLSINQSIESVDLDNMSLDSQAAAEIARTLSSNSTIKNLSLRQNHLDAASLEKVVHEGLLMNSTLQSLFLARNPLGDDSGTCLALLLKENRSLKKLCLVGTQLGEQGCTQVAKSLKHNSTLLSLSLDGNQVDTCGAILLDSLVNANTTLQSVMDRMNHLLQDTKPSSQTWKQIDLYLRANKSKRCLLYSNEVDSNLHSLSCHALPAFLSCTGNQADVLFYFLENTIDKLPLSI